MQAEVLDWLEKQKEQKATESSEDERIRKFLVELVSNDKHNGYKGLYEDRGILYDDVLAYLEKQKDEAQKQFNLGVQAGREEVMYEMEKEQKDYRKLYEDIAKSEWFKKAYEGKSLGCDYKQEEQKPTNSEKPKEWSEEDESALKYLHELISFGFTEKFFDAQTAADMREWLNKRLKSLRPQPQVDLEEIAKREYARGKQDGYWEGVKARRESCKTFYYEGPNWPPKMPDLPTETTTNKGVSSIRPHWKPSEEQMEALKNCAYGALQNGDGSALRELYNNLKLL